MIGEMGAFASLTPSLLARKGGAKPAMRRQESTRLAAAAIGNPASIRGAMPVGNDDFEDGDDLGWNDFGDQAPVVERIRHAAASQTFDVGKPEVLHRMDQIAQRLGAVAQREPVVAETAAKPGKRAAFTLRLDAERHFQLKMAALMLDRSSQSIVTEALDRFLAEIPGVSGQQPPVSQQS
ncbi:hypothetical protein [Novosphingobium aureum]|nr:hypothetical protein [Novosphingobium aureum]